MKVFFTHQYFKEHPEWSFAIGNPKFIPNVGDKIVWPTTMPNIGGTLGEVANIVFDYEKQEIGILVVNS